LFNPRLGGRHFVDHRDDLVKTRTQTVNRPHMVLTHPVPGGAGRNLSADHAADLLRGLRARDAAAKTLRALAMDLISEVAGWTAASPRPPTIFRPRWHSAPP
jgi:transposase